MSRWFRHYAGMCADPKFGGIARRAKVGRDRVVFVFCCILEGASERNNGGSYEWDADAVADLLNCETDEIERVHAELAASGIVDAGRITSWSKRQFESDKDATAAERQRRFRDKSKAVTPVTDASRVTNAPHSTETDTDTEEAATAASSAGAVEKLDEKEVERRCVQATDWLSTSGISAIVDLIAEGYSLDDRILPMLRTIAGELRERGQPPPRVWAFAMKAIRDPTRKPVEAAKPVEMAWVPVGSPAWKALAGVKRESYLRSMLKPGPGGEGIYWSAKDLPPAQGAAA
jgi:hypothetical protein